MPGSAVAGPPLTPPGARRLAAEEAARDAKGPGSLRAGLLDQLFTMDQATVVRGVRLHSSN
jgi:hydroxyethylthiazole kinase-like sugar kinase family protein